MKARAPVPPAIGLAARARRSGPNLSQIGSIRPASLLEQVLVDPTAAMLPQNRSIRAVTTSGQVVTGRRLNEDTYTVLLIDAQERLVSLVKADLREYTVIKTSPMPSYKDTLTPANGPTCWRISSP